MIFSRTLFLFAVLLISLSTVAQNVLFNSSGGTPDVSALMELRSTEQGFLTPRMLESQRLVISTPAQGLLVFQTDGTVGFYFYNGAGWDTLGGATTVTNVSNVTNVNNSGIAVIRDEKASGVDGGRFQRNDWRQRDLNTIGGDQSFVTLGTNGFTLDSGTYIIIASAPAYEVNEHQIRLFNTTSSSTATVGTTAFAAVISNTSVSNITTVVSVGPGGESFEIQHQCSTTKNNDGFGIGAPWGENVFTQVKIEKL